MSPLAPAHVDLYGRRVPSRTAFAVLAAGTVLMIGLSCWLEEIILRKLPGWRFHWTMAFFELAVFGGVAYLSSHDAARVAPLRLYVAGAACMGLYSAAGKMAYDYVNYATGTVLKSAKLVPVMAVSVLWLRRTYHPLDYLAAALMTASAALFGLGERELSPDGNTTAGFLLSFLCLALAAAIQRFRQMSARLRRERRREHALHERVRRRGRPRLPPRGNHRGGGGDRVLLPKTGGARVAGDSVRHVLPRRVVVHVAHETFRGGGGSGGDDDAKGADRDGVVRRVQRG